MTSGASTTGAMLAIRSSALMRLCTWRAFDAL
jgi:hypothetical protein